MEKAFWKSKTMWFNFLSGLLALATALTPVVDQLAAIGFDAQTVATARAVLLVVNIVGNMILRSITADRVVLKS